jgi:2-oxoisovalerate dehydrogenase E1 component
MFNRAEIIDRNFVERVSEGVLPEARVRVCLEETGLRPSEVVDLFESQVISRHLDLRARILKNTNDCFYTIGSSGHEGNAVLGKVFRLDDMAFLHYRSGALMIQRAKQLPGSTPTYDAMLSFVASSDEPISGGRHKVFGSLPLNVPPQTSTIASHLPKAMGAALSIALAHDLGVGAGAAMRSDSVVLCTFGDASANHSTALGAINTASWIAYQGIKMPVVFVCEDNGIGISVPTPLNWIERSFSTRPALRYLQADGLDLLHLHQKAVEAVDYARQRRKPVFLHVMTVRLMGHAGSDMELSYSTRERIEAAEFNDPLLHSARLLMSNRILSGEEIVRLYESTRSRVAHVARYAITLPKLTRPEDVRTTITACVHPRTAPPLSDESAREQLFGRDYVRLNEPQHMAKLLNYGLADIMLRYPNALIFGEDVAQKGGVYNVTAGLWAKFGQRRVFNSLLDEQSILGTAIGMAHNGLMPIPEIQFLAYVHNAEDQIRGEAATLAFFSKGQFTNPMVIRVAGLPYQKGFGGHFHNDNSLAVFRDIPGVMVAVPSTGADAVKMMRTCVREAYESGRVVVFVEPIALYMAKDLHDEGDKGWSAGYPPPHEEIGIGEFGVHVTDGTRPADVTVLTYGNGTYLSRQAAKVLDEHFGINLKIVDLRWIAPLNTDGLCRELVGDSRVLVVDECRKTGSLSEALVTMMVEGLPRLPRIETVAAHDCFIPLGVAAAAGLPSKAAIIEAARRMVGTAATAATVRANRPQQATVGA